MGSATDLGLEGSDRAFAHRLHREVLVFRTRLDRAVAGYCSRPLGSLDPQVLAALRVGAVQLLVLGTPPHAAVSATVGAMEGHSASGLVNAVLRSLVRSGEPSMDGEPDHVRFSHPQDLVERWTAAYGRHRAISLMEWNNSPPVIGGCFPDGGEELEPGLYLPDYRRLTRTGVDPMTAIPPGVYLQDEATVLAARGAAELAGGGRVLEIGAAPGGKTVHLDPVASLVVSLDPSAHRMLRWGDNAARLGLDRSVPVTAVGEALPFPPGMFDLVFVDAPCTNTGVYRRRPGARWRWSRSLLETCVGLQAGLLESAAGAVAPGGVLYYSTCSLEPEENHVRVWEFEKSAPEFSRIRPPLPDALVKDDLVSIFPPEHGIDGIFAAAWRRGP